MFLLFRGRTSASSRSNSRFLDIDVLMVMQESLLARQTTAKSNSSRKRNTGEPSKCLLVDDAGTTSSSTFFLKKIQKFESFVGRPLEEDVSSCKMRTFCYAYKTKLYGRGCDLKSKLFSSTSIVFSSSGQRELLFAVMTIDLQCDHHGQVLDEIGVNRIITSSWTIKCNANQLLFILWINQDRWGPGS